MALQTQEPLVDMTEVAYQKVLTEAQKEHSKVQELIKKVGAFTVDDNNTVTKYGSNLVELVKHLKRKSVQLKDANELNSISAVEKKKDKQQIDDLKIIIEQFNKLATELTK